MRVLVTGAAGFIGSQVVRRLASQGDLVVAVDRPGCSRRRLQDVDESIRVEELDILDTGLFSALLRSVQPAAIIHLAWYVEPGRYLAAIPENLASLQASVGVLRAAAETGCPRVVLGGTCLEGSAQAGGSIYEASKRAAHAVGVAASDQGLSVACGHVFHLYGPWEDDRRVVPSVISALLRSESIATTDGAQQRDYLHVADVAAGFCALAASDVTGGVDICSGSPIALREVFETIERSVPSTGSVRIGELGAMADDGTPSRGDPTALRDLGWTPAYGLRDGLADTINWWRQHGSAT
jgi:nucleoside-diphosphate-sugar epimerase